MKPCSHTQCRCQKIKRSDVVSSLSLVINPEVLVLEDEVILPKTVHNIWRESDKRPSKVQWIVKIYTLSIYCILIFYYLTQDLRIFLNLVLDKFRFLNNF